MKPAPQLAMASQLLKASCASYAPESHVIRSLEKRKNLNRIASTEVFCGATGNRTRDTRIFSPLLYQLSYGTRFCLELPYLSIGIAKVDIIF